MILDKTRCIDCGACVAVCLPHLFRMEDGVVTLKQSKYCMDCGHCTAACPTHAIAIPGRSEETLYPTAPIDPLEHRISTRRSYRRFTSQCPGHDLLTTMLNRSEYAPSAKNFRNHRWIAVTQKETADKLAQLVIEHGATTLRDPLLTAMHRFGFNNVTCDAPCLLLCCGQNDYATQTDAVIATTTVELLLQEKGLGTCWGGYLARIGRDIEAVRSQLGLNENETIFSALMVGYPDGTEHYITIPGRLPAKVTWL